jgi:hypothetical protein
MPGNIEDLAWAGGLPVVAHADSAEVFMYAG